MVIGEVRLSPGLRDELVAWARAEYPNEACGILAGDGPAEASGRALRFYPTANEARSPLRYRIATEDQYRIFVELDERDEVIWGIFHSHVRSPAVPSPTDVGQAYYPDALYLLCSLADAEAPDLRAWTIRDGVASEVPLVVA